MYLTAAREAGIRRAVIVSSLSVYGDISRGDRLTVSGPAVPNTIYGQIQLALESRAQKFAADVDVAILRSAGVFGPKRFGFGSHSSRFVERMLFAAATGQPVHIEGCWEDEDDLIYIKDVGEAIGTAALMWGGGSFSINVGMGHVSTLRDIADAVLNLFPTAEIAVTPTGQSLRPSRRLPLDTSDMMTRLGTQPSFPLAAAIRDYAFESGLIDAT